MVIFWGFSEFNNNGNQEECGEVFDSGVWNDILCYDNMYMVCEKGIYNLMNWCF